MKREIKVAIVGQGPNQTAWKYGLKVGEHNRCCGRVLRTAEEFAEDYCARVAITGRIGEKLAKLAGMERLDFYRSVGRFNLNSRWNGKEGKGDKFDRAEASHAMATINSMPFTHYVLLGSEVARAFGYKGESLETRFNKDTGKNYLLFPHPSGINTWWNEPFNVHRAEKRLREFLLAPNVKTGQPL